MHILFVLLTATAGGGEACQVDVDCQGGFYCSNVKVCTSARVLAAQAPEPYVPPMRLPRPQLQTRPDGGLLPPGAHLEDRPRTGLIIGGAATLGAVWLLTWSLTAATCFNCKDGLVAASFVPVIGPIIQAVIQNDQGSAGYALDAIIQTAGVAMIIAGVMTHKEVLVYDVGPVRAQIAPTGNSRGGGLGVLGSF